MYFQLWSPWCRWNKLAILKALWCLGNIWVVYEDDEIALSLYTVAMGVHMWRAECLVGIADIFQRRGRTSESAQLLTEAKPLFEPALQSSRIVQLDARLAALAKTRTEEEQEKWKKMGTTEMVTITSITQNSNQSHNNEDGSIEVKVQITPNSMGHPIFSSGEKSGLIRRSQNRGNSNGE
ncbi:hypothetical protein K438DRAFT_1782745 [Mycena galopus ATCC 62051]|nr:hypothetical protein K438DRAFT_1782745 [Mycena galopus ATCC 62051]